MASVHPDPRGAQVRLQVGECGLLASLVSQVVALLAPGRPDPGAAGQGPVDPLVAMVGMSSAPVPAPVDPALRRLLPDAYRDDDEAAGDFRRFTDSELRATKTAALRRTLDDLASAMSTTNLPADPEHGAGPEADLERELELDLPRDGVVDWVHALADVRLAVGTRLDVSEDMDGERATLSPGDPRHAEVAVYDWLSWLQDALVQTLTG